MSATQGLPGGPKADMRCYTMDEANIVVDNETYRIQDLHMFDQRGRIVRTVSTTVLHRGKQTSGHINTILRGANVDETELYQFLEGTGIMMLDKLAIPVNAGDWVYIEKGRFHKVINTSNASDLIFVTFFNGEISRPHLKA